MPMNRKLYPKNWDAIALAIKTEVNWTCENCDRPCRRPGETDGDLQDRIYNEHAQWWDDLWETEDDEEFGEIEHIKPVRFTLTVAHLDHQPENCDRSNLRAWCSVCHCRYDLKAMPLKKRLKAEREGQLNLLVGVDNA
uniref:HNH endonuclease n=1 Tax=Trichocoleus desertorum TaxID=1481672 RepID=UPI0025B5F010|nr:HNH endonuclease [Trichocoleus desertorum]